MGRMPAVSGIQSCDERNTGSPRQRVTTVARPLTGGLLVDFDLAFPKGHMNFGRLLEGVSLIVSYHGDVSMRYGVEPYDDIGFRAVKER